MTQNLPIPSDQQETSSVVIVEDEPEILEAVEAFCSSIGLEAHSFMDAESAIEAFKTNTFDLLISDLKLPGMDGLGLCDIVSENYPSTSIMLITAFGNINSAVKALEHGVDDFILKPFTLNVLRFAIDKVLEKRRLVTENQRYQTALESLVATREMEINQASYTLGETYFKIVYMFGNAQESREIALRGKTERVAMLSIWTSQELGLTDDEMAEILLGAPVADVGKLTISEKYLNKPQPLNEEEREIVRDHVSAGIKIVKTLAHFKDAENIIKYHHERYDGSGYSKGLKGDDIPRTAAIVGLCDEFDAILHHRNWRAAFSYDEAVEYINSQRNIKFKAEYVDALLIAFEKNNMHLFLDTNPIEEFYSLALPLIKNLQIF